MTDTNYTTVQITVDYREKLRTMAKSTKRSMAAMLEVLIDAAYQDGARDKQSKESNHVTN